MAADPEDVPDDLPEYRATDPDYIPDLTPRNVNYVIKAFSSKLCCTINPVAKILGKIVCQDCFERLREEYGRDWEFRGSGTYD